jgi:hypothetical protein
MNNEYGPIPVLDKEVKIQATLEGLHGMICEACGIKELYLPVLRGKSRIWVDLLFHKKRKELCRINNPKFKSARIYS